MLGRLLLTFPPPTWTLTFEIPAQTFEEEETLRSVTQFKEEL